MHERGLCKSIFSSSRTHLESHLTFCTRDRSMDHATMNATSGSTDFSPFHPTIIRPNIALCYAVAVITLLVSMLRARRWAPTSSYMESTKLPQQGKYQAVPPRTLARSQPFDASSPSSTELLMTTKCYDHVITSKIAKVTALWYDAVTEDTQAYESALLSHKEHDQNFHYRHFVLRRDIAGGIRSRLAYMLSIVLVELEKAPEDRLQWIFWHDADLVLMNSQIPLEIFLPPEPNWAHINFIAANDVNGLNAGVFFLRVCEWSLHFVTAALAYRTHNPVVNLRYAEQTALLLLTREERWQKSTIHVPQRWFNAYHNYDQAIIPPQFIWKYGRDEGIPSEWNWKNSFIEPGDLLVHLPGSSTCRKGYIKHYLAKIRDHRATYIVPLNKTKYGREITDFWPHHAQSDEQLQVVFWRRFHVIRVVRLEAEAAKLEAMKQIRAKKGSITSSQLRGIIMSIEDEQKQLKVGAMRVEYAARLYGEKEDRTHAI